MFFVAFNQFSHVYCNFFYGTMKTNSQKIRGNQRKFPGISHEKIQWKHRQKLEVFLRIFGERFSIEKFLGWTLYIGRDLARSGDFLVIVSREYIRTNSEEFLVTHSGEFLITHSKEFRVYHSEEFLKPQY